MSLPGEAVAVCRLAVLQAEGARWCEDGVALVRSRGRVHPYEDRCPHAGGGLLSRLGLRRDTSG